MQIKAQSIMKSDNNFMVSFQTFNPDIQGENKLPEAFTRVINRNDKEYYHVRHAKS